MESFKLFSSSEPDGDSNQTKKCHECLADIPKKAKKCSHCGSRQKTQVTKEQLIGVGAVALIFVVLISVSSSDDGGAPAHPPEITDGDSAGNGPEGRIPDYEVMYEVSGIRYDGGKSLYILIDPIDSKSDSFKDAIRSIVKKVVAEKGNALSIEIHDKWSSLDLSFKQYGDMSLGRALTQTEFDERAIHLIATYDGNLKTNIYPNSLSFFPGAFKEHAVIGRYVETIEYNAATKE